ncbi:MAG: hypothetical protein PWQ10_419 [Patescibacteria group bacterium]|nr:hypothetical protein [Patescibacteria group bacterium]
MKIFIICSKTFYDKVTSIRRSLEEIGHSITLPNCFDEPDAESRYRDMGKEEHSKWKANLIKHSGNVIDENDAVLVLNFDKYDQKNYIGGATFLEMYDAFRLDKKIYMYNDIPDGILKDEIIGFSPIVINQNLNLIV